MGDGKPDSETIAATLSRTAGSAREREYRLRNPRRLANDWQASCQLRVLRIARRLPLKSPLKHRAMRIVKRRLPHKLPQTKQTRRGGGKTRTVMANNVFTLGGLVCAGPARDSL